MSKQWILPKDDEMIDLIRSYEELEKIAGDEPLPWYTRLWLWLTRRFR